VVRADASGINPDWGGGFDGLVAFP
jgi:hypothetical protein